MQNEAPGHRCCCRHTEVRGAEGTEVSRGSRSVPSLQTPSTPTEYKSSRVSAWLRWCAWVITAGPGRNVCSLRRDACCRQLLGNSWGIIRRPGKASSNAAYSSFGSLLPPHPDSQLCSPVLGMKSDDSFLYTITLLELLPIPSFVSVCFGPEGGPVCQAGLADTQAPCLGPASARPVASALSRGKSLWEFSPLELDISSWRYH